MEFILEKGWEEGGRERREEGRERREEEEERRWRVGEEGERRERM